MPRVFQVLEVRPGAERQSPGLGKLAFLGLGGRGGNKNGLELPGGHTCLEEGCGGV